MADPRNTFATALADIDGQPVMVPVPAVERPPALAQALPDFDISTVPVDEPGLQAFIDGAGAEPVDAGPARSHVDSQPIQLPDGSFVAPQVDAQIQQDRTRGFFGADAGANEDTVGFTPAGDAAQMGAQTAGEVARTPEQQRLMDMAAQAAQLQGSRGDAGKSTKGLLRGRADMARQALERASAPLQDLEGRADVDQLLVEDAAIQRAERQAQQTTELANQRAQHQRNMTHLRQRDAKVAAEETAALEGHAQQIAAESEAIAEEDVRDRRTPGQRALATIAVALGGIGAAIANSFGGQNGKAKNDALAVVEAQIQRDVRNQEEALSRRQTALAARGRNFDRLGAVYSNADARRLAAQSAEGLHYQRQAEAAAQLHAGTNKGEAAKELALMLQAQRSAQSLEAGRLEARHAAADFSEASEAVFTDELGRSKRRERGSRNKLAVLAQTESVKAGVKLQAEGGEKVSDEQRMRELALTGPGGTIPIPNGAGGFGPTSATQAAKATDLMASYGSVRSVLRDMQAIAKGGATWDKNTQTEWRRLTFELTALNSVRKKQGATTDFEVELAEDLAGDPTNVNLRRDVLSGLQREESSLTRQTTAGLKSYNLALPGASQGGGTAATADELEGATSR